MKTESYSQVVGRGLTGNQSPKSGSDRFRAADPISASIERYIKDKGPGVAIADIAEAIIGISQPEIGLALGIISKLGKDPIGNAINEGIGWSDYQREHKEFLDKHDVNGDGKVDSAHDFDEPSCGGIVGHA